MSGALAGHAEPGSPSSGVLAGGAGSLPRPLTSFIGRERELAEARRLLERSCLLTLTGPGGSGKTRLCIELACGVAGDYPDGVYFVRLAPVRDPRLVLSSIAQGVGLPDSKGRPLVGHLADHLRDRKLLIVLDNFEHLLPAAPVVAELLSGTRDLRMVVSSRSPLRVSGEQECPVPPLALPPQAPAAPAAVAACESVRLFVERAAAVLPGFAVDGQNAGAVAQIVCRLDGLPLAIELAAARVRLLSPEAICERLEHSLGLLTGGSRDLPDRQQTLRATIEWSYDLLGDEGRELLAACSVFRGGIDLAVIESVCTRAGIGVMVLDGLQELVDQSLLRQLRPTGTPRYLMLETIREFAAERLAGTPDQAARLRGAHAAAFLSMAGESGRPLTGPGQKDWLERLDLEHNNLRAAIDWYCQEDPPAALRMAAAMSLFWSLRGHYTEGRQRLAQLLGLVAGENTLRVRALNGAAWLAIDQGDYPDADRLLGESAELSRRLDDRVGEGMAAVFLSRCLLSSGRVAQAAPHPGRGLALLTEAGDRPGIALAVFYQALNAQFTGDMAAACELHERCAAMCEELGFASLRARSLQLLGIAGVDLGHLKAARAALQEGLPASVGLGDRFVIPIGLTGFAGLAAKTGRHRMALRLAGAAEAYRDAYESAFPEPNRAYLGSWLAPSFKAAGAAAARLLAEGRQMTLTAALEYALANQPEQAWRTGPGQALTRREAEVAALAARGLTNRDIAARLCLSVRTVEVHIDRILTKLGFRTRTQLAAWAHEEGLLAENT
jgi:predicted ATPase/DNA-binding CsgD family transcriptional regulator